MLTDQGLQTLEQIKKINEFFKNRPLNDFGCIGSRLCKKCDHLISDSICLCSGYFICPHCGFENGQKFGINHVNMEPIIKIMKLTPVLKISESLLYDGFTPSKVKKGLIYNVATAEEREVPPDVLEGMEFLDGFLQRVFNKISNS